MGIYAMAIEREVGEIHTKVDHLIVLVEKQNGRVSKLEDQVSGIRRWQAAVIGAVTAVSSGVGVAISKVFHL